MPEKFAVKTHHAMVFVPLDKDRASASANILMVDDFDIGHEENFFSRTRQAYAPIQVFAM